MSAPTKTSTIDFAAADGTALVGDLAVPPAPRAAAIVCHPHPQYGGDRHNAVVSALFEALPPAGIAALRFDFRPDFDDGRGEALDAAAALAVLEDAVPDVPLIATGYSFGAAIALALDDSAIAAKFLIAPPLAMITTPPGNAVPTLVLTPEHDQFSPPAASVPIVDSWPMADHETIAGADHFLVGRAADTAREAVASLDRWLSSLA
ncbi:MAG: hypothetical protein HKN44_01610 [Ilumatobacter sp.]|nr:hypothetical protein [Ilumatobacter sp.]